MHCYPLIAPLAASADTTHTAAKDGNGKNSIHVGVTLSKEVDHSEVVIVVEEEELLL